MKHQATNVAEGFVDIFARAERSNGQRNLVLYAHFHVVFEAIAPGVPATLAAPVLRDLLRGELGFGGVVISDDLEMKAISEHFGVERAAVRAIEAGVDVLLVCSDVALCAATRAALVSRAREDGAFRARLEDAARRALALRRTVLPAPVTERAELEARLQSPEARALEAEIAARAPQPA